MKKILHKDHIARCSATYAEQCVSFCNVQKRRYGNRSYRHGASKERYHQHLQRTGIHKKARDCRPQRTVSCVRHHHSVCKTDGEKAHHYRYAALERIFKTVPHCFIHGLSSLVWCYLFRDERYLFTLSSDLLTMFFSSKPIFSSNSFACG